MCAARRTPRPGQRPSRTRVKADADLLRREWAIMATCAWCTGKIPEDMEALGIFAETPDPDGSLCNHPIGFMEISGRLVHFWALAPEPRGDGRNVAFMVCGQACLDALDEAIVTDRRLAPGAETGPAAPGPSAGTSDLGAADTTRRVKRRARPSPEAIRQALEAQASEHCAWCGDAFGDRLCDALICHGARPPRRRDRVAAFTIDGKPLIAIIPEAGSDLARQGVHYVFPVCGDACLSALEAAVLRDLELARVQ